MKTKKETICAKALRILEPIPEGKWITKQYGKVIDGEIYCCALGHFNRSVSLGRTVDGSKLEHKLRMACDSFLDSIGMTGGLPSINDGDELFGVKISNELYNSIGPKQRVVLFLKDAVKAGY